MKITHAIALTLAGFLAASCAADDPNRKAKQGALIGAVAGAVVGNQTKSKNGKLIGAALGGIAGYSVGKYQDDQRKELEAALANELAANMIDIQRLDDDVLRVNLSSEASFDVNQADVKNAFHPSLDKLAAVVGKYDQTMVVVIGHTDSSGDEAYNQVLSERRSQAVANYLSNGGITGQRLSTEGRGELSPRTGNDTEANRRANRRVEIDLIPVVKQE